jgi:hypothetical protein
MIGPTTYLAMEFQYQYTPNYLPDDPKAPLYDCLHFLITPTAPAHFFLAQVLPPNSGFSGKEGWLLRIVQRSNGNCYYAATGLSRGRTAAITRDYDIQTVRQAIRATLDQFAHQHPGRKLEIDGTIRRFNLTRDGSYTEPYLLPPYELD